MILKHYFDFGEEANAAMGAQDNKNHTGVDWEYIRQDRNNPAFSVEKTREEYIASCQKAQTNKEHAEYMQKWLENGKSVCSLGAGKGILEWHLKTMRPDLRICCSDYAEEALNSLKCVFTECDEFKPFDMLAGDYEVLKQYDALIMYRISTEFNEEEWRRIFAKIYKAGVSRIFFVPTEIATIKDWLREQVLQLRSWVSGRKPTFAGWMYSADVFSSIFEENFSVVDMRKTGDTAVYVMDRKD